MYNFLASLAASLWGPPAFRAYARARSEPLWREVAVYASPIRNIGSGWPSPFFAGTAIAWADSVIAIGEDFAVGLLREQFDEPASRDRPVEVIGGRLRDPERRQVAEGSAVPSWSEVLAHECGHTWQARRYSWLYLPIGAIFTLFREGQGWTHWFENQASELGLFGGIVNGSVRPDLLKRALDD